MQVHNMLEKDGHGFKVANIKLIKVKPEIVEVHKKTGELLKYKRVKLGGKG